MDEFFKRLAAMRGQFELGEFGFIRHRTIRDVMGAPACPLVSMAPPVNRRSQRRKVSNSRYDLAGKEIGLSRKQCIQIVGASDKATNGPTRRRILEAVGLAESPNS